MKKYVLKFSSLFILAWLVSYTALAQFDDIYFDPDTDQAYVESYTREGGDTYVTENYYYDDEDYDYYDRNDQDFYYSSRIRRFSRPMMYSAGFYDPFFFDPFYYGGSGMFLSLGNRYNSWNRWNRFNRFNNFAFGYGNFYDPFFFGGRGFNAFDPYFGYCPPTFFNRGFGYGGGFGNNFYNTNNFYGSAYENYQPVFSNNGSYYGARRGGSVAASPSTPVKSPRSAGNLTTTEGNRTITNAVRSGDTQRNSVVEGKTFRTTENAVNSNRVTKTYTPTTTTRTAPRETYRAVPNNNSTRSVSPTRTESTRTYSPSPSSSRNRSYTPSSTSPSKSYAPSRSASPSRSYTPSRTSTPSRNYSPSKSGSSSSPRSYSPSSSSTPRSSGSSGSSSRSSSPRRN